MSDLATQLLPTITSAHTYVVTQVVVLFVRIQNEGSSTILEVTEVFDEYSTDQLWILDQHRFSGFRPFGRLVLEKRHSENWILGKQTFRKMDFRKLGLGKWISGNWN